MQKKGQVKLQKAPEFIITLLLLGLILAIGAVVMLDFRDSAGESGCSVRSDNLTIFNVTNHVCWDGSDGSSTAEPGQAYNASTDTLTAVDNVSNQLGTVGTVLIASVLLGLIVTAFVFFTRR